MSNPSRTAGCNSSGLGLQVHYSCLGWLSCFLTCPWLQSPPCNVYPTLSKWKTIFLTGEEGGKIVIRQALPSGWLQPWTADLFSLSNVCLNLCICSTEINRIPLSVQNPWLIQHTGPLHLCSYKQGHAAGFSPCPTSYRGPGEVGGWVIVHKPNLHSCFWIPGQLFWDPACCFSCWQLSGFCPLSPLSLRARVKS